MPVLVTAADAPLGSLVAARLLQEGGEVRGYCTGGGAVAELRGAGAIIATGDLDDEGRLEAAMADVHTVIHLGGGLHSTDAAAVARDAGVVATAAGQAGIRRLIALSLPGADPAATEPLRRAKGEAEQVLARTGIPTVVIRTSLVDSGRLRDALAGTPLPGPVRDRTVAPLRTRDLVEVLAQLDAVRSEAHEGHVVFHADGPTRMSLDDYRERVGLTAPQARVGRTYRPAGAEPLLIDALDGPWVTDGDAAFDAWRFTGVRPGPVVA
jgi:uncharacterized protein YbjT (DUF2867 family)